MYEFAGSKSAKLVVTESGKLVARFLQSIACLTRVQIYNKISHVALCFAVFHNMIFFIFLFYTVFLKVYSYPPRSPSAGEIVHESKYKTRKYLFTVDNCICKIYMCFDKMTSVRIFVTLEIIKNKIW